MSARSLDTGSCVMAAVGQGPHLAGKENHV